MPFDLSLQGNGSYLAIEWTGAVTPQEMKDSGIEAIALATKQGIAKILIDVTRITNRLSIAELYLATDEHSKLGPPRPRGALLGRRDQERELSFIETAALNRGMPIKSFTNEQAALSWLMK